MKRRELREHIFELLFRVEFNGELYNIAAVDHMNYRRKSIKLSCEKVRR